ncbi:extracellular solute-binding protein [Ructibacterium gallinarum]|uniref:Extracellular solute-binding protein n=1 Tax=Ructibacterium gallinarum TaxID=2779355 RepID=A0A9D5R930_9FIRM|nr:extracellular solute-binding protein [Ructibacterium gallinarum]MBE5040630.1 extracellular solute-binding protein [Ructibacterium gallinarum]
MMKFLKQGTAIACAVLLAGTCLAGCGGSSDDTEAAKDISEYQAQDDKEYTISWTAWIGSPVEENADMVNYWNEKFNVKFDVWNIDPSNYGETLGLKIAGGDVPDVLWTPDLSAFYKYGKDGILTPLTDEILKTCAPEMYDYYMSMEPNAFKYRSVDGVLYGIPSLADPARRPLVYRGDWLEKMGVENLPDTLEEFEDLMYRFAKEDPDGNGKDDTYGMSNSGLHAVYGAYGMADGYWIERDGKLVYCNIQPEMKEALALLRKWYQDGVLDPEFIMDERQVSGSNMSKPFVEGRVGFTASGEDWHYKPKFENGKEKNDWEGDNRKELRKLNPTAADSLRLGVPLTGPNGSKVIDQGNIVGTTNTTIGFGAQLKDQPDKLAKILDIINQLGFTSRQNSLEANNGIEGVHWKFDDEGRIEYLDPKYEQYTERAKIGGHTVFQLVKSLEWDKIGDEAFLQWEEDNKAMEYGLRNELKTILPSQSRYGADLDKIVSETYIAIITGDEPIEYFDEFVEKWKKAGGEQLEKEANEWYASIQ